MSHTIDWTAQRVTVRYHGPCCDSVVLNAVKEIQCNYRFDSTHEALHDFSDCESWTESLADLEELSARNSGAAASMSRLRIAVIPDRPDVLAMLKRFNSIGMSPYPLCAFVDIESANDWLRKV
jgi:hypothetical protein